MEEIRRVRNKGGSTLIPLIFPDEEKKKEDESGYGTYVNVIGNKIYFDDEVTVESKLDLFMAINNIASAIKQGTLRTDHIDLYINSPGGYVTEGLAIYDFIKDFSIPIDGYILGSAASMATIILQACRNRYAYRSSLMLIHQISGGAEGKLEELKDSMVNDQLMMTMLKDIYKDRGLKMSEEELDEALTHDIYWHADKCKEVGLIDKIVGDKSNIVSGIDMDVLSTFTGEELTKAIEDYSAKLKIFKSQYRKLEKSTEK